MYAIIKNGGRQFKVTTGQVIEVDRLEAELGQEVILDKVLFLVDGETIKTGRPILNDVTIKAIVTAHDRAKKIRIFKKKRRKGYHKAQGHRQNLTALKITSIEA